MMSLWAVVIWGQTLSTQQVVLMGLAMVFGFYMAWNIGANDLANAMGTSVGSRALTLRQAVILGAILEMAGSILAGAHVAETMRNRIVDLSAFQGEPGLLALGMLSALLAAGVWLQVASYFGWPVSTTHSIVGAIAGFGAAYGGLSVINWSVHRGGMGSIVASWIISPVLSGVVAYFLFRFLRRQILTSPYPVDAARRIAPWLTFCVMVVLVLVLMYKGLENVGVSRQPVSVHMGVALVVGLVGALVSMVLVRWKWSALERETAPAVNDYYVAVTLRKAIKQLRRLEEVTSGPMQEEIRQLLKRARQLSPAVDKAELSETNIQFRQVEKIFVYLQIMTAAAVAFSHGANDVANAVAPMSVVVEVAWRWVVPEQAPIGNWALVLGGIGITIGLASWGWRVIETVGRRITDLTPTRGFSAEFATALTVLGASKLGLPISTTHTLVGAVMGVGLARGISALNLNAIRDIVISWLVTVPLGAGLAVMFFYGLQGLMGWVG